MIRKACVTAVLAASLASPAWADSFSLGVVNPVVSQTVLYNSTGLSDNFSFTIGSGDWVTIDFQAYPEDGGFLPIITFKLLSPSDPFWITETWNTFSGPMPYTATDLDAGTGYVVNVYGGLSLPTGSNGSYELTLSIGQTAPVPEPETYAMLLAGLGLLGLAKRRRQKLNA